MSWSGFRLGQEDYLFMLRINRELFVQWLCTLPSMLHFVPAWADPVGSWGQHLCFDSFHFLLL